MRPKTAPRRKQCFEHITQHEKRNRSAVIILVPTAQLLHRSSSSREKKTIHRSRQDVTRASSPDPEQEDQCGRFIPAYPLPPNDVKVFFTLFSKYFSTFDHSTCSLSDSRQYLAFAEVHLRVCTALSNCATCGTREGISQGPVDMHGTIALCGGTSQNA